MTLRRPITTSLLYWLLVVCGLAGISMHRLDAPAELAPLWLGTVAGVGLGQLLAAARVRPWVFFAIGMAGMTLWPVLFLLYATMQAPVESLALAFVPALLCGYLSLSERGALVAFWYPAVLWMVAVLDGTGAGGLTSAGSLPLVIGLGALFVAFMRARETRRVAIWRTHGSVPLAEPMAPSILRASPLRAATQHAWTAMVGASALALAVWVAPHLWQTEGGKETRAAAALARSGRGSDGGAAGELRCCAEGAIIEDHRVRVREYLPLVHGHDEERAVTTAPACRVCSDGGVTASVGPYDGVGDGTSSGASPPAYSYGTTVMGAPALPRDSDPAHTAVTDEEADGALAPVAPLAAPTLDAPAGSAAPTPSASGHAASRSAPRGRSRAAAGVFSGTSENAPSPPLRAPWQEALVLASGFLALRLASRFLRRAVTLRHLARPFWPETLDQRISNHWERVLIGLRDAGIHPIAGEQPEALARRVGIDGVQTCATILERVRHGVRVDAEDLAAMDAAAEAVYRAARSRAGVAGRAAALVRWPLA